ncbi:MAG: fumarylacetoacetate hydrolase family protein, partial [Deltaproteobacteria bacterium]|nr:fumarylacetoacetate hydrolase family protein [Deltaproteobacteria bacterium]
MSARLPGIPDVDETFFTLDEVGDVDNLNLTAMLDGVVMQEGNTRDLIFSIPYLMAY